MTRVDLNNGRRIDEKQDAEGGGVMEGADVATFVDNYIGPHTAALQPQELPDGGVSSVLLVSRDVCTHSANSRMKHM